jgi:hypothetical protein
MKPLSEQLEDLAQHAKKVEDSATATRSKNQAELQRRRDQLKSAIESTGQKLETSAAKAREDVRSGWVDIKRRIDERLEAARMEHEKNKAERDRNKAERRAQVAEEDAAYAITLANYVLDQAESAVVDAALARAHADGLRAAA